MNDRLSWEEYALELARAASRRSEDPYVKVGACALRHDNSVASVGYNGAPPKITIDWSNREERSKRVIHAETNCLRYVKPGECRLIAVTLIPCGPCLINIASYGIKKVVFGEYYIKDTSAITLAQEFGIELIKL